MLIGILGCGSIGQRHIENLYAMGHRDLVAYDPAAWDPTWAFQREWLRKCEVRLCESRRDLLAAQPRAIVVCTPPASHWADIHAVLESNADVFVEKPMTLTQGAAADVVQAFGERPNRKGTVGYQLPFTTQTPRGWFYRDELWLVHEQDMQLWPGGYAREMLSEFSHEIHLACYWKGPVTAVAARQEAPLRWTITLHHLTSNTHLLLDGAKSTYVRYATKETPPAVWTFDQEKNARAYREEMDAFLHWVEHDDRDPRLCRVVEAAHVTTVVGACHRAEAQYSVEVL